MPDGWNSAPILHRCGSAEMDNVFANKERPLSRPSSPITPGPEQSLDSGSRWNFSYYDDRCRNGNQDKSNVNTNFYITLTLLFSTLIYGNQLRLPRFSTAKCCFPLIARGSWRAQWLLGGLPLSCPLCYKPIAKLIHLPFRACTTS